MRISIREALFSGEEVDDWEPPKGSEWVLIGKDKKWFQDLIDSLGLDKFIKKDLIYNIHSIWTDAAELHYNKSDWSCNSKWDIYYRPDEELIFIYPPYNIKTQNVEAVLEFFSTQSIEELQEMSRSHYKLPKELLK